jgi:outer membrane protein assembly factor BamE (lipoprotein component of BamABCDE complex)
MLTTVLGKKRASGVACIVALAVASACGDDDKKVGLGGSCLSNQQICQFPEGTSQMDVQKALGNAQEFLDSRTWIYICQEIQGQQIVHNDLVSFDFDDSGRLTDVTALRMGAGATPPPDWPKCAMGTASSAPSGPCAGVPLPAPDSAVCRTITFGTGTPTKTDCMDQKGNDWSADCSTEGLCTCAYGGAYACQCTASAGACCPGVY